MTEMTEHRGAQPAYDGLVLDDRLRRLAERYRPLANAITRRYIQRFPVSVDYQEWMALGEYAMLIALARWEPYCERNHFTAFKEDGEPEEHLTGFITRTVTGQLLDASRRQDHVSRSQRRRLKDLAAAEDAGVRGEAELSAATGITPDQIRAARQADSLRVTSLDAELLAIGEVTGADSLPDGSAAADVESSVMLSTTLAAVVAEFDQLPAIQRVLLSLVYHQEMTVEAAAEATFLELAEAQRLLAAATDQIHQALLAAAS
jgi:DNA-directed RNA polymerase specialized sigma subunit